MVIAEESYKGHKNAKAKPNSDSDEEHSEEGNTDHYQLWIIVRFMNC